MLLKQEINLTYCPPYCTFVGGRDVEAEVEERSISIIFNLLQNLGPKGGRRERVAAKFVESEFEKCDRLMELYFRSEIKICASSHSRRLMSIMQESG